MVTRRSLLAALAASAVIPQMLRADEFIDLDWVDLLPKDDTPIPQAFRGLIDHDQPPLSSQQPDFKWGALGLEWADSALAGVCSADRSKQRRRHRLYLGALRGRLCACPTATCEPIGVCHD